MRYCLVFWLFCASQSQAALVFQATLQDDTTGTTVTAQTGTDGTLVGESNTSDISEDVGPGTVYTKSFHFDNVDDEVQFGTTTGFPDGAEVRTICMWVRADTVNQPSTTSPVLMYASFFTGADIKVYVEDGAISVDFYSHRVITPKTTLAVDTWYHVAIVVPSGATTTADVDIYIDSVNQTLSDEVGSSQTLNTTTPSTVLLGKVGTQYFDGYIADFRVYNSDESANLDDIMAEADGGASSTNPNPITPSIPGGTPDPLRRGPIP